MKTLVTVILFALLSGSAALAQTVPSSGATRSITQPIGAAGASGVTGSVFIGEYGENLTAVVIVLRGTPTGGEHPAHFHKGKCGSGGGIVVPLSNINGDTGLSVTLIDTPYDAITSEELYVNVHASPADLGTIVACGEVGASASPVAGQNAGAPATQNTPVATQEFGVPSTMSYGVFAVNASGISGNLQLTEQVDGGTTWTLGLSGITQGNTYAAVLYQGDCGPDRPEVLELESVGPNSVDMLTSITDNDVPFGQITEGDYFLYVFDGEPGSALVACGEVGVGANR